MSEENKAISANDIFSGKVPKSMRRLAEAFLKMRKTQSLEDITVVRLCELADVNKSTFYHYYHDVYDLSDQLQSEVIHRIVENFEHVEAILTDPGTFVKDVLRDCRPDSELIAILFAGNQIDKLPRKVEEGLKKLIAQVIPDRKDDMSVNLHLTYQLYGAYYAFMSYPEYDKDDKIEYIAKLTDRVQLH